MEYRKPDAAVLAKLQEHFPGRVYTGENINDDFKHDEMPFAGNCEPDAVVTVLSTEEVSDLVRLCYEADVPFIPRGAGTGLSGAALALHGGLIIDMTKMNKILSYDLDSMCVRVQPGVLVGDLQADAEAHGVLYAPDPGEKLATVGGNVATNAGGMRACKYGTTREHVLAMTVVTPTGDIMRFGAEVSKNCSGYSLMNLISGSEGTLAIITELSMKVLPIPEVTVSLLAPFADLESAVHCVGAVKKSGLDPQALELMMRENVEGIEKFIGEKVFPDVCDGIPVGAYLLVTFDAENQDILDSVLEKAADVFTEGEALDVLIYDTADGLRKAWNVRGNALEALEAEFPIQDECDIVVPVPKIAELIMAVMEIGEKHGLVIRCTGHAGDGNIHVNCCAKDIDEAEFLKRRDAFFDEAYKKGIELGGLVSGEHGIGIAKVDYLAENLGQAQLDLMKRIKEAFDPKMLLNPGKVCYKL